MLLWKISDCPGVSAAPAAYFLSLAVDVAWILLLRVFHVMHKSYAKFLEFLIQSQSVGIWLSNSIFDCKYLSNLPAYIFSCGLRCCGFAHCAKSVTVPYLPSDKSDAIPNVPRA